MRLLALLSLLSLNACTGEWGDWMQADKPDEDHQFFCGYYNHCGKSQSKALYGDDHSLKAGDNIYKEEEGVYGSTKGDDVYGKTQSSDLYGK